MLGSPTVINEQDAGLILAQMVQTSRTFRQAGQRNKDQTFTGTRFGFLQHLRHRDARLGELAIQLFVSAPVASRAVDCLETDGLVERRPDPEDARAQLISITERGRLTLSESEDKAVRRFADALSDWSTDDADHAITLLQRLNQHLGEITRGTDDHGASRPETPTSTPDTRSEMSG